MSGTKTALVIMARAAVLLLAVTSIWGVAALLDTRPALAQPSEPSDLTIDDIYVKTASPDQNRMDVTWEDNSTDETSFEVQYKTDGTDNWESTELPANSTEWSHKGVTNATRYSYQVRACSGSSCSGWAKNTTAEGERYVAAKARPQWDDPSNFTKLDYGVYWFRCGKCRTNPDGTKTSNGIKADPTDLGTSYYDPDKPTVIYVHGIQENGKKQRESFVSPTDASDMAAQWKTKGYNVGLFYWNQIADDNGLPPRIHEGKVWGQWSGKSYWRWRKMDGSFVYMQPTTMANTNTVADLFRDSYAAALKNQTNPDIRLAAHSMGNQVAIRGTSLLQSSGGSEPMPKRVALLDPYYSQINNYLTIRPRDEATKFVSQLKGAEVLFEYYKTSAERVIDTVDTIAKQMAYVKIYPNYTIPNQAAAHGAAVHWYLSSPSYSPPAWDYNSATRKYTRAGVAPSAAMPDSTLQEVNACTTDCKWWTQRNGKYTKVITDDDFVRRMW